MASVEKQILEEDRNEPLRKLWEERQWKKRLPNEGEKTYIRPFTRQFYRGNGVCFVFSLWETLLSAIGNLLIWLMQQLIDQIGGYDTGFSLAELAGITLLLIVGIGSFSNFLCAPAKICYAGDFTV